MSEYLITRVNAIGRGIALVFTVILVEGRLVVVTETKRLYFNVVFKL